jgi:cyanophycin synthetase
VAKVNQDQRRGDEGSGAPLSKLKIDDVAHAVLAAQGYTLASVPPAGQRVLVRRNPPYFKNGGNLVDLTDLIHSSTAAHAIAAAQALQLRVAGLDVVALDIGKPLEEQGGVIVEINAGPGLWLHLAPWADSPRPVGEDIVAAMFPTGSDGRIPVAAIIGDGTGNAKKHLKALLTRASLRVGVASDQHITVGERQWAPQVKTPQERAALLMQNPTVDVALLETSLRELLRAGFGNDRCDVAIVLDTQAAEEATAEVTDPEPDEFMQAVRHTLGEKGVLVRPAERETTRIEAGGRTLLVREGTVFLTHTTEAPQPLGPHPAQVSARELPGLLAALAAGLVLGASEEAVKGYLGSLS